MNTPEQYFNDLMVKEIQPLKNFAYSLTRNTDESADLVQDTILKAYRYKDKFSEGTNLRGWLYTILKNSFINNYRRDQRRSTYTDSSSTKDLAQVPAYESDYSGEIRFIGKDLEDAVNQLSPELKITFVLNAEGFKYHEIAEELNIPIGTVKTRIFVARRILREKLAEYATEFGYSAATA